YYFMNISFFFFSSRRRHTRSKRDWSSDVCSSDLKYDINKLVSIQKSIDAFISGEKISERRNDRYADVGDEIILDGHLFIVEDVYPQYLKDMTEKQAKHEGFESLAQYKEVLTSIHDAVV